VCKGVNWNQMAQNMVQWRVSCQNGNESSTSITVGFSSSDKIYQLLKKSSTSCNDIISPNSMNKSIFPRNIV